MVMVLNAKLLHPLQGVDTTLVTIVFTGKHQYVTLGSSSHCGTITWEHTTRIKEREHSE